MADEMIDSIMHELMTGTGQEKEKKGIKTNRDDALIKTVLNTLGAIIRKRPEEPVNPDAAEKWIIETESVFEKLPENGKYFVALAFINLTSHKWPRHLFSQQQNVAEAYARFEIAARQIIEDYRIHHGPASLAVIEALRDIHSADLFEELRDKALLTCKAQLEDLRQKHETYYRQILKLTAKRPEKYADQSPGIGGNIFLLLVVPAILLGAIYAMQWLQAGLRKITGLSQISYDNALTYLFWAGIAISVLVDLVIIAGIILNIRRNKEYRQNLNQYESECRQNYQRVPESHRAIIEACQDQLEKASELCRQQEEKIYPLENGALENLIAKSAQQQFVDRKLYAFPGQSEQNLCLILDHVARHEGLYPEDLEQPHGELLLEIAIARSLIAQEQQITDHVTSPVMLPSMTTA